jgi:hypothetical protein
LIGSIRRECLDYIVVFGDAHLRRILAAYAGYYNELQTHLSLDKDSPPIGRSDDSASSPQGQFSGDSIITTGGCNFQ